MLDVTFSTDVYFVTQDVKIMVQRKSIVYKQQKKCT
jgi:hypothetical protein